jgi:uncharacterized protein
MPETHHILFYDYVEDILDRRAPHRDAHLARIHDDDRIVMAGPLGDPPRGAAIVFRTADPEVVERFARDDPYVQAGLVTARRVELWNVV